MFRTLLAFRRILGLALPHETRQGVQFELGSVRLLIEAKSRLQLNTETSATICAPKQSSEKLHVAHNSEPEDLQPLPEQT